MSTPDQSPVRARAMTSLPTGRVHSLPLSTSRSHAARLCATGSKLSATAAQLTQDRPRWFESISDYSAPQANVNHYLYMDGAIVSHRLFLDMSRPWCCG